MTTHKSLQLRHESQDLSALAASLAFPVARIWTSGTQRKSTLGNLLGGCHDESYVALKITSSSAKISEAINIIKKAFAQVPKNIEPSLSDPKLKKTLYCTIESGGEEITPDDMKILVDLGIELGLD